MTRDHQEKPKIGTKNSLYNFYKSQIQWDILKSVSQVSFTLVVNDIS